ncbi:inorganic diphosphatase [Rozella allomycis CSF55]|uniref:Inorganic pyrophosphatase n=1 Tax=Rozella allomycis (strain CSF55) TaxID=988480 RepID=A0A075B2T4_ROZAC|nr:Inorganic pyrophosphatase domain-containing protein [Rozella allomycis CSF55]RKP21963.1 inorganic diphosphatase [Rozella allomycis CSF55]|eukprot:EPZ36644.1 Inorganic pyrophosphatase domain-containing protein [Rozella allomycis CSF55]
MSYKVRSIGAKYSSEFRTYIENAKGQVISPFHDIPLYADEEKGILNFIVEIPRWSNAKMEISTGEFMNPIKQDVKKGQVRFVKNVFPFHGYIWNYGAFPQTWEDPTHTDKDTTCKGDNDPVDVLEIGESVGYIGQVKQVKVLGAFALIDDNETDWKVIVIDINDPLAEKLNDIEDVNVHMPGLLRATLEWLKVYKIPDGKPVNKIAFAEAALNKEFAIKVIKETHEFWKRLITNAVPSKTDSYELSTSNVAVEGSPHKISFEDERMSKISPANNLPQVSTPTSLDKWYYVSSLL